MRAVAAAAVLLAFPFCAQSFGACPAGPARNCVDLNLTPQISQQIVAKDPAGNAPKLNPNGGSQAPYTGLTVGVAPNVRRAPTVGYRWAID